MDIIDRLNRGAEAVARLPGLRGIVQSQARGRFLANRDNNMFWGVHSSWDEAVAAAVACGTAGYDNAGSAALYTHRTRIDTYDYPALCWIMRSADEGLGSVFDVGGSIGIKYLAFKEALARWPALLWTVQDVPAVVEFGRKLSAERGPEPNLAFTSNFNDGDGIDLLYASGVLQYLPASLGDLLSGFRRLPRRLVINTTAIHSAHDFFTVNSVGTAFCPYRVQTQATLVRGLTKLGYRMREVWTNTGKLLVIPDRPEYSLRDYSGYCLDLKA